MRPTVPSPDSLRLWRWQPFALPLAVCLCLLCIPLLPPLGRGPGTFPSRVPQHPAAEHRLRPLWAATAAELQQRLEQVWSAAADNAVPGLAPRRFPEDLDQLPVADRKEVFLRSLLPHVLAHNESIARDRSRLVELSARAAGGSELRPEERQFLGGLAERYRLELEDAPPQEQLGVLLRRVDVVPPSLALAQGAIESAWGTSRFAQLGNNLFGQWLFDRDRGIAPLERADGAKYSLAQFAGLGEAVGAYLRNLNGFYAYQAFRRLRGEMRAAGEPLDAYRLAAGLSSYSTRRGEYVKDVRSVIRSNDLTRYDGARLALPPAPL